MEYLVCNLSYWEYTHNIKWSFELKRPQKTSKNVLVFFSFSGEIVPQGPWMPWSFGNGKIQWKIMGKSMEHLFEMGAMFDYRRLWSDSLSSGWEGASNIILHSPREMGSQGAPHFVRWSFAVPSSYHSWHLMAGCSAGTGRWLCHLKTLDLLGQWSIEFYRYGKLNPNRKTYRKTHYFFLNGVFNSSSIHWNIVLGLLLGLPGLHFWTRDDWQQIGIQMCREYV